MLGINTFPSQDPMVVPFLASSGYTFTAVRDADETIQKAYKANVAPTNVLIDTEGRVVARPILGNSEQERWLGAWIELLLPQKKQGIQGQRPDAPALSAVLAESHVPAPELAGVRLDRRISNYASENSSDVYSIGFYWDDEVQKGRLPDRFQVLVFEKAAARWTYRSFQDRDLPRTEETPPGVGIGAIMRLQHTADDLILDAHINPSASATLVLSRALEPKALLYGLALFTLSNQSIVYERSQVHFAPTHWLEVYMYDPASGVDRKIYPLRPYGAPRLAYMKKLKAAYDKVGEAWCREHNHHCNPELFDSSWARAWAVDQDRQSAAFLVQFGIRPIGRDPEWPDDTVPIEDVVVACRNMSEVRDVTCSETRLATLKTQNPGATLENLLRVAARRAGTAR